MEPTNPHDRLFKGVFSAPEEAAAWLSKVLPGELVDAAAMDTLRLEPGSFVDEALGERHTDLLFSIEVQGGRGFIYVLLEHQRSVDPMMAFRVLRYMVRVWDRVVPDGAARLPFLFRLVVFNGTSVWTAPVDFDRLLEVPADAWSATRDQQLRFRYHLVDLSQLLQADLPRRALGRLALLLLGQAARGGGLWRLLFGRGPSSSAPGGSPASGRSTLYYNIFSMWSAPSRGGRSSASSTRTSPRKPRWLSRTPPSSSAPRAGPRASSRVSGAASRSGNAASSDSRSSAASGRSPVAIDRIDRADDATLQRWTDRLFDASDLAALFVNGDGSR